MLVSIQGHHPARMSPEWPAMPASTHAPFFFLPGPQRYTYFSMGMCCCFCPCNRDQDGNKHQWSPTHMGNSPSFLPAVRLPRGLKILLAPDDCLFAFRLRRLHTLAHSLLHKGGGRQKSVSLASESRTASEARVAVMCVYIASLAACTGTCTL